MTAPGGGRTRGRGPTTVIRSSHNPRVRAAAALARRKVRDAERNYLVEGVRAVTTALAAGEVIEVFAVPEIVPRLGALPREVALTVVDEAVVRKLANSTTPQGVVAVARQRRARLDAAAGAGFLVVLCGVAEPGNAGAIVRTADAAGSAGVVFTRGSVDPWNPKAVRAAAGSLGHIPVVVDVHLAEVVEICRARDQRLVALDAGGAVDIHAAGLLAPPVALLFGNEAHGLPLAAREAGLTARVPHYGRAESLGLAAAVAVVAYAAARVAEEGERA